jgi:hypothetical protein
MAKVRNFGGVEPRNPPPPSVRHCTGPIGWGNVHVAHSLTSIIVKSTKLHGIVITTFGNVKSITLLSFTRINLFSIQLNLSPVGTWL